VERGEEVDDSQEEVASKRHAAEQDREAPAKSISSSKPNPFAKKPVENGNSKANPFLKNATAKKSIQKSESFFKKVDEAESEREKKTGKKGKAIGSTKQGNLLERFAKKPKESKGATNTQEPTPDVAGESQETQVDSQASALAQAPKDLEGAQAQETPRQDEMQVETQEATQVDSQAEPAKAMDEDENDDVIDWPPSRPPTPPPAEDVGAIAA